MNEFDAIIALNVELNIIALILSLLLLIATKSLLEVLVLSRIA